MHFIQRYRLQLIAVAAVLAAIGITGTSSSGQQRPVRVINSQAQNYPGARRTPQPTPMLCPNPVVINQTANSSAAGFNSSKNNSTFKHTFEWKLNGSKCCQYLAGTLTVYYHALEGGPSASATSANDLINVNGLGPSVPLWSGSVQTGQHGSKTFTLTPSFLANLGTSLTFTAEDDTAIDSATLSLSACCLGVRT